MVLVTSYMLLTRINIGQYQQGSGVMSIKEADATVSWLVGKRKSRQWSLLPPLVVPIPLLARLHGQGYC